ncbi:TPA: hypothetical protein ACKQER_000649 [Serratia marcescens]|uniref:hypothetical protein n=1 Tax=Serratia bockelmannii TaxID=2703793 RepID=UPI0038C291A4
MTLTTTEELKHLASSDNANELTRRLARECLANREAQPVDGELGVIREESVLELNRENIPGLGTWYVQLRIGASHDEILARVYGATPEETMARARMLASMRARPQPSITDEAIDRIVLPLSPEGLDEEKYHCEWHLYHDRERIRKELREYFTAQQTGEYGDAYQGAREDLSIWKRRALEAEDKVRHLEKINDHLVKEAQGEHRMGEPMLAAPPAPASEPIFFIEVEGDDWINAGRIPGSTFDFNNLPDGVNKLYAAPPAPAPAPANANAVAWEMRYWNSGHNMWHDWERITAEQHAEMSVQHAADNDYEFRILYDAPPAPAPAVA